MGTPWKYHNLACGEAEKSAYNCLQRPSSGKRNDTDCKNDIRNHNNF